MTSDKADVIWDPFAGLFTTAVASFKLDRRCYCAEVNEAVFNVGVERITDKMKES